jgi:hypothetical protein
MITRDDAIQKTAADEKREGGSSIQMKPIK